MDKFLNFPRTIVKPVSYSKTWENGFKYFLKKDDLTIQDTNVIVNAANNELWMGAGVAGAIRKKGGDSIQEECNKLVRERGKSFENGDVVHTGIGKFRNPNLKFIFHAVGPIYYDGLRNEKEDLINAFRNCFLLADKLGVQSIALPPISSGIFGYPKFECACVFYEILDKFVKDKQKNNEKLILNEVRMTIIDDETFNVFEEVHKKISPNINDNNIDQAEQSK